MLLDFINGPKLLKIKENKERLTERPINFMIKKNKYIITASKKYFITLIINYLVSH